jgi:hypothetical protein
VCGIIDPGHICDDYMVLFAKSGMTVRLHLAKALEVKKNLLETA